MNRGEKAFLLFCAAYVLAYLPCLFLFAPNPNHFWPILSLHIVCMILGVPVVIIVFRDLYKRHFSNPNTKVTWAILMVLFAPSIIVYVCQYGIHPRVKADGIALEGAESQTAGGACPAEEDRLNQSSRGHRDSKRKLSWTVASLLLLFVLMIAVNNFIANYTRPGQPMAYDAPPFLPVKLEIVYDEESVLRGGNCVNYSGTATYTFYNEQDFPITLAFPPICYYTYYYSRRVRFVSPVYKNSSQTVWQEQPFPDEKRLLPEFARQQRDVVIPAGQSVAFTAPFNMGCFEGHPSSNHVFVFGLPSSPCSHPVLGTVYAKSVKATGTPKDFTHTESRL